MMFKVAAFRHVPDCCLRLNALSDPFSAFIVVHSSRYVVCNTPTHHVLPTPLMR